jgi:hypothetical protein
MLINTILDIRKGTLGDYLLISHEGTVTPELIIADFQGNIVYESTSYSFSEGGYVFFNIELLSTVFESNTYYIGTVEDGGFGLSTFLLFVTQEHTVISLLYDIAGLSGVNIRFFDFVYTAGNLTACSSRIYETEEKLQNALSGSSDDFLTEFSLSLGYDNQYNLTTIESKVQD